MLLKGPEEELKKEVEYFDTLLASTLPSFVHTTPNIEGTLIAVRARMALEFSMPVTLYENTGFRMGASGGVKRSPSVCKTTTAPTDNNRRHRNKKQHKDTPTKMAAWMYQLWF